MHPPRMRSNETQTAKLARLVVGALGLLLHGACGSHEEVTQPTAAGSTREAAGGGKAGGSAGSPAVPDLTDLIDMTAQLAAPMCNMDAVSVSECGGVACPALPPTASLSCTINCCSAQGTCGQRSADLRIEQVLGTSCTASAVADARCPGTTLAGTPLVGCCDAQGHCGQIFGTICIATGTTPCDTATAADAGVP